MKFGSNWYASKSLVVVHIILPYVIFTYIITLAQRVEFSSQKPTDKYFLLSSSRATIYMVIATSFILVPRISSRLQVLEPVPCLL